MRLMRRIVLATPLFYSRAASGVWRSRRSCLTEAAMRLMRRIVITTPLFIARAAQGIWRSRRSCLTEALALLMSKRAKQTLPTLKKSWTFCRREATMSFPLGVRNDAESATSSIALHAKYYPPPPPWLSRCKAAQENFDLKSSVSSQPHFVLSAAFGGVEPCNSLQLHICCV